MESKIGRLRLPDAVVFAALAGVCVWRRGGWGGWSAAFTPLHRATFRTRSKSCKRHPLRTMKRRERHALSANLPGPPLGATSCAAERGANVGRRARSLLIRVGHQRGAVWQPVLPGINACESCDALAC